MLIGISGKIQSGKDTVAKIIKELDDINYPAISTVTKHNWEIHKFADPLKDIICILTGCTREQLEDIEFKNSKLPEEWKVDRIRYNFDFDYLPTYREALQYIGTDLLRTRFHENTWINALFNRYKPITYTTFPSDVKIYGIPTEEDEIKYGKIVRDVPNWIITDCRFPNEAEAIKARGGVLIRVNRRRYVEYKGQMVEAFDIHPSETALDDYPFEYTIDNNGTLEELREQVKAIYNKIMNRL